MLCVLRWRDDVIQMINADEITNAKICENEKLKLTISECGETKVDGRKQEGKKEELKENVK